MEEILFYLHFALLLFFGILLSAAFSGIRIFERKNLFQIGICFAFCGLLQLWGYFSFGEETVWKIYPLITHFPIVFWLCVFLKKGFLYGYRGFVISLVNGLTSFLKYAKLSSSYNGFCLISNLGESM